MKKSRFLVFLGIIVCLLFGTMNVKAAVTITTDPSRRGTTDTNSYYITNQSTLTINGVVPGDQLSAYKVLDAYYNQTSNAITYEFTEDFQNFLASSSTYRDLTVDEYYQLTSGNITSGSTQTESTLDTLVSAYATYIKNNSVSGTAMSMNGTVATLTADAGVYLVLPTQTMRVYAVMVGNLDFVASGSDWNLNTATIVAKVSEVGINKTLEGGEQEGSFGIGENITFVIQATVPKFPTNAINRVYTIHDTLSAGLTFGSVNDVTIRDGSTPLTISGNNITDSSSHVIGTIAMEGQQLTINFTGIQYIASNNITITYQAELNDSAVLGSAGNSNSATLTYSNDPYGDGTSTTTPSEVFVYTYGLEIFKYYNSGDSRVGLSNAVFEVFSDAGLKNKVGSIKTETDGYDRISGLKAGTYYIKEVTAPTGYALLSGTLEVEITNDNSDTGTLAGYHLESIPNTKIGSLPSTGGIGAILYLTLGIGLMVGAVVFIVIYRKKKLGKQNS